MEMLHHPITTALPFFVVFAADVAQPFSWSQALLVYGPLGLWVFWFILRDRLDREERKQQRLDDERRHQENITAQKRIEEAFRMNTNSIMIAMGAVKNLDGTYTEMLMRIKEGNVPSQ